MNAVGLLAKKNENLLFSENVVIEQSSSKCPGLSVHTVKRGSTYFIPQHILFISIACKFLAKIEILLSMTSRYPPDLFRTTFCIVSFYFSGISIRCLNIL